MITVRWNGAEREVDDSCLGTILAAELPDTRGVAVAVNETVVPRSAWDQTRLSDGDRVEVLVAAQGG